MNEPAPAVSAQPRKIVFTGDFLRPAAGRQSPTQHENIDWLAKLLQVPVQMACGLPCETVHWDNRWGNRARFEVSTVEAIYGAFWRTLDIHNWPHVFAAQTLPDIVEEMFLQLFGDSLLIGFELPPYMVHFCARHDIPFIDCSLSPVRFMDDLLIDVSSNRAPITSALKPHRVSEDLIHLQAGVLSSTASKAFHKPPLPNCLLLILQTIFDKVVIEQGRFTTVLDHLDTLRTVATDYDHVLIKEHPLEPQPQVRNALLSALDGSAVTTENFYRLVSHHNLAGVAALSSSCVVEAGYFGKKGHYLLPDFTSNTFTPGAEGVNIDHTILMPDFWRDLLKAAGCAVSDHDRLRLPAKPNRFRQQLRSAWGYNQVDTDISARWAKD